MTKVTKTPPKPAMSRRGVIAGLAGVGSSLATAPAWAFSLDFGDKGISLDVVNIFNSASNLFEGYNLDEEDETRIGNTLYGKLVDRSGGAYPNRKVQAAMERFADPLIRTSTRKGFSWEITVINDNRVNAWALPGGKLAVNKGVLRYVDDESALAAVIAHEIGHVELSHGLKQLKSEKFNDSLTDAAKAAITRGDGVASLIMTDKLMDKLAEPIHKMVTSGYARNLEDDADMHILDVFARTGHDPARAADLFKVLLQITPENQEWSTSLFNSHPETKERIEAIEERAVGMAPASSGVPVAGYSEMKRSFPTRRNFRRKVAEAGARQG